MNKSIDIRKQLEVKNKEIYINKLNLDLDNNLEVLVLTIDNLLNFITNETTKRIVEIKENLENKENISKKIQNFIDFYRENLMNLLDEKKNNLENLLITNDGLEICKNNLKDNYLVLKLKLEEFSKNNIDNLDKVLQEETFDNFKLKRLNDYLNNIFITNLNKKVLDIIKSRDIILINTFHETYLKYLELNKNTVGV